MLCSAPSSTYPIPKRNLKKKHGGGRRQRNLVSR